MDRKINVFIGGSSEGLKFAEMVKTQLEIFGRIECTVWNDETFQYNDTFLNSLTKASLIYDFGIFIASNDDLTLVRDEIKDTPRDNVVFEYGLFLGNMGNNRTFLIQEADSKLPTDLLGYTTPRFKKGYTSDQWNELCKGLSDNIQSQFNKSEIQLLPSTALAIGYFNSFITKVSLSVFDNDGCLLNKADTHHKNTTLIVLIPNELSDDISAKAQIYYRQEKFELDEIGDNKRPFPIRYLKSETDEELLIIDIPTTLGAIRPSINLLISDSGIGANPDKIRLEQKELENFKKTMEYLIEQNDYSKHFVKVEWMN